MSLPNLIPLCKSAAICAKLLYDSRKNLSLISPQQPINLISALTNRFGRLFLLSEMLVDIEELRKEMPEECMKFLLPGPDRKMMLVANLKMNGNAARLEKYCDCINNTVVCLDKATANKVRGRKYKTQLYPDLVDVVIAPPYPYLERVSKRLRIDCKACRDCEECQDCSDCAKCDCVNCNKCRQGQEVSCCKHKCFEFSECDQNPDCYSPPLKCETKGEACQCEDCGLCEFCQSCYRTDCADCSICVQTGAQNSFPYISGGLSGEISPRQIREMGGRWIIIGSSERRELFHETDELIGHKVRCALMAKMKVVVCISDTCKDDNNTDDLEKQMMSLIPKIGRPEGNPDTSGNPYATPFRWNGYKEQGYFSVDGVQDWNDVVIAYEPVWALKKGLVPTPLQAQIKCNNIREILEDEVGKDMAKKIRILYGGPVDSECAPDYANMPAIDGFLIGTTGFKVDELVRIANAWFIKNRPDAADTQPPDLGPDGLPCPEQDDN